MPTEDQASTTATYNGVTVDFSADAAVRRFPGLMSRNKQTGNVLVVRRAGKFGSGLKPWMEILRPGHTCVYAA
jgi:hypothetical protein